MSTHDIAKAEYEFAAARKKDPRTVYGIPWGFPGLDAATGGIHQGEMTVFGARPGVGKTSFLCQVALNVAQWLADTHDARVARVVSVEVTAQMLLRRMASMKSGVSLGRVRSGKITDAEFEAYKKALQAIANLPLEFLDDTDSIERTERFVRGNDAPDAKQTAWFGVDYLGIHPVKAGFDASNVYGSATMLSNRFRALTKYTAPGLVLSQFSRGIAKREDKRPQLTDFRDSGSIEQDASTALAPYREDMYLQLTDEQRNEPQRCEMWLLKQRNGPAPWRVNMLWNPPAAMYEDDNVADA